MSKTQLTVLALLAFGSLSGAPLWARDEAPPPPTAAETGAAPPAAPGQAGPESFLSSPSVTPSPVTGESVEPDITIREAQGSTIYEYRVRGQLYMVRIQPRIGPPYFLIDTDGNGTLDQRNSSPTNVSIPQWLLFSWD